MIKLLVCASLASLLMSTESFAKSDDPVSTIDVSIDLGAVTNQAAALRYSNIVADLTDAITAILVNRIAAEGMKLDIDLSEVELSSSYTETVGSADTRLVGSVNVSDALKNENAKGFVLIIDVNQARPMFAPEVDLATLSASSDVYYSAMIAAFAQNVVLEMDK